MVEFLNVFNSTKSWKSNLIFLHHSEYLKHIRNNIFRKESMNIKNLASEEAEKGLEQMEGVIKEKGKIRFLYCPRCALRKPDSEILGYYGGFCPSCGGRMVIEEPLLYKIKNS